MTIDYTAVSLGGKESHKQADWILRIREMRRVQTRTQTEAGAAAEAAGGGGGGGGSGRGKKRAASTPGGGGAPKKASGAAAASVEAQSIAALKLLRSRPVDIIKARRDLKNANVTARWCSDV